MLRTLLYWSFSSSLIFLLLGSWFPSSYWRGPIPALIVVFFFYGFVEVFWVFLIAAIALVSLTLISVFIEIFMLFSIPLIWLSTFYLVCWFVDLCIFFGNFDIFLIKALLPLCIMCFLGFFFCRTCFFANFQANVDNLPLVGQGVWRLS